MERLETKSAYRLVVEIQLGNGSRWASVGVKPTGLDVSFHDGQVLHYDLEGRLIRLATPNVQWRRGLSHRAVCWRKRPWESGGGFESQLLDRPQTDRLVDEAKGRLAEVRDGYQQGRWVLHRGDSEGEVGLHALERLLGQAAAFDSPAARQDLKQFESLYGDVPILPPDQYGSLVLLATEGCAYNQCTFCGFYRGAPYREKSPEEFREHLRQAVAYHGRGLASRRGVFLGQANALVGPRAWRVAILEVIQAEFQFPPPTEHGAVPAWWQGHLRRFDGIASFVDAVTGVRITSDEFTELRRRQLRRLYLGLETGDAELLAWLKKPAHPDALLGTVANAKRAGLQVGVIILIGAGGERYFRSHVGETIRLLQALRLGRGDYIYLSPLVAMPGTEHDMRLELQQIQPLSPERMAEQEQLIRTGLAAVPRGAGPYVAHYDVSHFVY